MSPHDLRDLSAECIALARFLAPLQNYPETEISDPPSFLRRLWDRVVGRRRQFVPRVDYRTAERLVNALLNAGNFLETQYGKKSHGSPGPA